MDGLLRASEFVTPSRVKLVPAGCPLGDPRKARGNCEKNGSLRNLRMPFLFVFSVANDGCGGRASTRLCRQQLPDSRYGWSHEHPIA